MVFRFDLTDEGEWTLNFHEKINDRNLIEYPFKQREIFHLLFQSIVS